MAYESSRSRYIERKKNKTIVSIMVLLIIAIMAVGTFFIFFNNPNQQSQISSLYTSDTGTTPSPETQYLLNVTVVDKDANPLKNVHVAVFRNGAVQADAFSDSEGKVSFSLPKNYYYIQFERYHYSIVSVSVDLTKNTTLNQIMSTEETLVFNMFPSWGIMILLGSFTLLLIYLDRKKLLLRHWTKPDNWFRSVRSGSWTFIDKSTKNVLYGTTFVLLIILLIMWIVPNIIAYENMAYYYILLGGISAICLFLEGTNRKYPIAAIGFGKKTEITGDILIGLSFAFLFIGVTGFASQLDIFSSSTFTLFSFVILGIMASFFEEAFFSGILAPTFAEKTGILSSIILTSVLFMFGHIFVYGWAFIPLASTLLFRVVATYIVLYKKSWLGVFVAHAIINVLSVITIMMMV